MKNLFTTVFQKINTGQTFGLLLPLIIIILFILGGKFILLPRINEVYSRLLDLSKNKNEVEKLEEKASFITTLNTSQLRQDLRTLERVLPSEKDASLVIAMIEGLAQHSGAMVEDISLRPGLVSTESAQMEVNNSLTLTLTFLGGKRSIDNILERVETTAPLISLSGVKIEYSGSGLARLTSTVGVHFLTLPQTLPDITQPLPSISEKRQLINRLSQFTNYQAADILEEETVKRRNLFSL